MAKSLNTQTFHLTSDLRIFAPALNSAWGPETLNPTPSRGCAPGLAAWGRDGGFYGGGRREPEALTASWAPN